MTAQDWIDRINSAEPGKDALGVWAELANMNHSEDSFALLLEVHKACSKRLVDSLART
jgi:hypothetical protein